MKAKDVLYQLSISQEYREFLTLLNALNEKSERTTEEDRALLNAAEKVFHRFITMINPTINSIRGCTKVYGNEVASKTKYLERIEKFKEALLKRCEDFMPDYYQYLYAKLPELWKPKNKKR